MPINDEEFEFVIEAFDPKTLPMNRLAEYMQQLASLLGEQKSVHFVRIQPGSVNIVHSVEYEAIPKVNESLRQVKSGAGTPEARRAARGIDQMLADDNTTGSIRHGNNIYQFPGKNRFHQPVFGPFKQPGTVDGTPIMIGGKNDPVPVHLQEPDGTLHICNAHRDTAAEIGAHIFKRMIRAEGIARWRREGDGKWTRMDFRIITFTPLKSQSLRDAVTNLRSLNTTISQIEDIDDVLHEMRRGE